MSSNAVSKLGAGRPASRPAVAEVRELTVQEVATLEHGKEPAVKQIRESHHRLAKLVAMGLRNAEIVAAGGGYSAIRISILRADPAFKELVAQYKASVDQSWRESVDEYFATMAESRSIAARRINDALADDEQVIPLRTLLAIHSDAADRTGYPKRRVAVNVNMDFAGQLEKAIQRSKEAREAKVIEHEPTENTDEPR